MAESAKILTKDDILNAKDTKVIEIDAPEWGGKVFVRKWSAGDLDHYEKSILTNPRHDMTKRGLIAALSLSDAEGNKLFVLDDVEALSEKSAAVLNKVLDEAVRINALDDASQDELEKN